MTKVEKSIRGYGSPGRYFQGPGLLEELFRYTALYGEKAFVLIDGFFFEEYRSKFEKNASACSQIVFCERFGGESSQAEIDRVFAKAKDFQADLIVGVGGGKTLDTAKAAAALMAKPVVVAPTTASTDAPCSALSIIYTESGEHDHSIRHLKSPDIVLVDSDVIAKAPTRFLVSGMGDALTTFFESRANAQEDTPNMVHTGYRRPKTGMAIARACYEILIQDGFRAKTAAEKGFRTEALENIIEVNTLMSGLGFENTGVAGAHSICDGITALPEGKKSLHGERAAFGVLVQLLAEGAGKSEIEEVVRFCLSVGLPVTLADIGIEATRENARTIAEASMHCFWKNEPFAISAEQVCEEILAADALGQHYKDMQNQAYM